MTAHDYNTGRELGDVQIDEAAYEAMAQQPEGLVRAGDILSDEQIESLGITAATAVWFD